MSFPIISYLSLPFDFFLCFFPFFLLIFIYLALSPSSSFSSSFSPPPPPPAPISSYFSSLCLYLFSLSHYVSSLLPLYATSFSVLSMAFFLISYSCIFSLYLFPLSSPSLSSFLPLFLCLSCNSSILLFYFFFPSYFSFFPSYSFHLLFFISLLFYLSYYCLFVLFRLFFSYHVLLFTVPPSL